MKLVECVPNFSEGRRPEVIAAIRTAAEQSPGVHLLDQHADWAHNRLVLTFVGRPKEVAEAAFLCVERAAQLIDLEKHHGEHPRMGATDVVPFVPLGESTMDDCIQLARQVGARIGDELRIPVYLYYEAATRPERRWLPNIRRGQYEQIKQQIGVVPERQPDFGPARLGPAGATAVGARPFLIAFNVNLASADVALAQSIAGAVRQSGGGLPAVQARGMATTDSRIVQVSTNLLDYHVTPLHQVYERIRELASRSGVEVASTEVVGLVPTEALTMAAADRYRLVHFGPTSILEARLVEALLNAPKESGRSTLR
jgi:glutamate formiminotransferase